MQTHPWVFQSMCRLFAIVILLQISLCSLQYRVGQDVPQNHFGSFGTYRIEVPWKPCVTSMVYIIKQKWMGLESMWAFIRHPSLIVNGKFPVKSWVRHCLAEMCTSSVRDSCFCFYFVGTVQSLQLWLNFCNIHSHGDRTYCRWEEHDLAWVVLAFLSPVTFSGILGRCPMLFFLSLSV